MWGDCSWWVDSRVTDVGARRGATTIRVKVLQLWLPIFFRAIGRLYKSFIHTNRWSLSVAHLALVNTVRILGKSTFLTLPQDWLAVLGRTLLTKVLLWHLAFKPTGNAAKKAIFICFIHFRLFIQLQKPTCRTLCIVPTILVCANRTPPVKRTSGE